MPVELFRPEALTHAERRITGTVVLKSAFPSQVLAWLLCGIVFAGSFAAANLGVARKETVTGWLSPSKGLVTMTAPGGGVVQEIHVVESDLVRAGSPIATLRLSPATASGDSYQFLAESFALRQRSAAAETAAAIAALEAERVHLDQRVAALEEEQVESRQRVFLQEQRLMMARAEVERARPIAERGFLPGRELEARRSAALQAEQTLSEMRTAVLAGERQIKETQSRLRAIPNELRAARAAAERERASLNQEAVMSEVQATYQVVASVAGRIGALTVSQGQSIPPGASIGVLTPPGGGLVAELYAPSRAAGFIEEGQEVRIMYRAFPFQKFGTGKGRVVSVSDTVIAPSDVPIQGLRLEESVFRIRVQLKESHVNAYGRQMPLQPGMLVDADVIADRRTLVEWLFDPLYAAGRR